MSTEYQSDFEYSDVDIQDNCILSSEDERFFGSKAEQQQQQTTTILATTAAMHDDALEDAIASSDQVRQPDEPKRTVTVGRQVQGRPDTPRATTMTRPQNFHTMYM